MKESKSDPKIERKPRSFNRIAAATAVGVLIGIVMAFSTGKNDVAVISGTVLGALVGFGWDWLANRKKNDSID
jgi:phosphate/sulfate permease